MNKLSLEILGNRECEGAEGDKGANRFECAFSARRPSLAGLILFIQPLLPKYAALLVEVTPREGRLDRFNPSALAFSALLRAPRILFARPHSESPSEPILARVAA